MTRVLICDAPLPRAGWVEVGSRRPAHPEDSGYFFPDGRTRAKHIAATCAPLPASRRAINSCELSRVLSCGRLIVS